VSAQRSPGRDGGHIDGAGDRGTGSGPDCAEGDRDDHDGAVGGVTDELTDQFTDEATGAGPHAEWISLLRRRWQVVTAAAVIAALLLGLRAGARPDLPAVLYLAVLGVLLTAVDLALLRLPDPLTLPSYPAAALLLGVAAPFTEHGGTRYLHALVGMAALWLFYAVQWFALPGRIGLGDVKLAGVLGLYLGWYGAGAALFGVVTTHLLAGGYAIVLLVTRRAGPKSDLPFGPFMVLGTFAAVAFTVPPG
jgi:leader peptidase (prepilin peptidase)/N-methyltransferase